ncbi:MULTISPECIES: helix-turn-helix domain-containing protein [Streptomyces]|uniref:helix-turn-helix domain-containing protein n=1 Tax=Streptomyces TaxID=1883 RepID=UPI00131E435D|nr:MULTISPECIES: helix-turn-helix transcriptional regulator [Streptomyces]MCH0559354.1 hypothetical protein [Streptomyces sp. MUM 16J]
MADGALEPGGAGGRDSRAEFGRHIRGLFDSCGLSLRQFTQKHGFSHSAIARYLSGERLPRKAFLDALLGERGTGDVVPATAEVRQLTFSLYRAALEASGSSILLELYELEVRLESLRAELDQVHAAQVRDLAEGRARGEADAGVPGQDSTESREVALAHRRTVLLAELDHVRHEISRRENTPAAQEHAAQFPPIPPRRPWGETPPSPPGSTTRKSGGGPGTSTRAPWAVAGFVVLTAAVFFGMWIGRPSTPPGSPTASLDSGPSGVASSAPAHAGNGHEPKVIASTRVVIPRGQAVDADSRFATLWSFGYEYGDFQVSNDPAQDSMFTGNGYASLALSKAADWPTCGLAEGFENQTVTAASLDTGATLCGITSEGNRCALTVETVRSDSRGVRSVTVRFTTWDASRP